MARKPGLGRAESDILRFIVEKHPITVREVGDFLTETKGQTRTTALNVMERLREKGYLVREQIEGSYKYSPTQSKAGLFRSLVHDFVDQMLGGSLDPFVAYLSEDANLSEVELVRLREAVAHMETRHEQQNESAIAPTSSTEEGEQKK